MWYTLFSAFFWLFLVLSSFLFFAFAVLVWLVTVLFDKRLWIQHLVSSIWGSFYLWTNPLWPVTIEGREKIDNSKVYVAVSNHQSMLDILVLHSLFFHFKWVSKKENVYIPFVGWNMILNRYVILDRASRKSFIRMMRDCRKHLSQGSSVMIFPEGTRSADGQIKGFKDGAFTLAKQTNHPILPIVLDGTGESIPKNGFVIRKKTPIRVKVLDPVYPDQFENLEPGEINHLVREKMESALDRMREKR